MTKLTPNPALGYTKAYGVPKSITPTDLRLSGNEGLQPPAHTMALLTNLAPSALRDYPSARELEAQIATMHNVDPAQVLVTAGADDALYRVCQAMLGPDRAMVISTPTFEMIPRYARLTGAQVRTFEWANDGPYPVNHLARAIDETVSVVAVISPNNPTGAVISANELEQIAQTAPDALILLDHAYVEFAQQDLTQVAMTMDRVVVTRTFSKAWGLAGLRTGYVMGPAHIINWLRAAGNPYAVTGPSIAIVRHMLNEGQTAMQDFVRTACTQRDIIKKHLEQYGAHCNNSQANFVFGNVDDPVWWRDVLAGLGIAIRVFEATGVLGQSIRMSSPGTQDGLDRLIGALGCLTPDALLLDMDGVMVDVSSSYRTAIIETGKHFGVTITGDDITAIKARGNANNDWKVTHELITQAGKTASLEDVTAYFELLYQGNKDQPGLWEKETALLDRDLLVTLSKKTKLGIVTGRPKRDAERFLKHLGVDDLFKVVICMEDAPAKPNPEPIVLAMKALNAKTAWMVGDTPDDIRSARRASHDDNLHILPLGILAPQDQTPEDRDKTHLALLQSGAGRILQNITMLKELLP